MVAAGERTIYFVVISRIRVLARNTKILPHLEREAGGDVLREVVDLVLIPAYRPHLAGADFPLDATDRIIE